MKNLKLASLPWYDTADTEQALDQFWEVLAEVLHDADVHYVPASLQHQSQSRCIESCSLTSLWQSPQLILSQCCGPDLFTLEASELVAFARPIFQHLDCRPGHYYSHIVSSHHYKLRQPARIAVNSLSSRSGYSALTEWLALQGVEVSMQFVTGSHQNSLHMLQTGQADLAAIDAQSWCQCLTVPTLPIVGRSVEALAPPYVHHLNCGVPSALLFKALQHAIESKGSLIGVMGAIKSSREDYRDLEIVGL